MKFLSGIIKQSPITSHLDNNRKTNVHFNKCHLLSAVFEKFLKAYIENFKYKSITTQDWKQFLYDYFSSEVIKYKKTDLKGFRSCSKTNYFNKKFDFL